MEKNNQFRTSIGGQALIEGILMRGPEKQAIVVRSPEGLVTRVEELTLVKDKYPILGWPIMKIPSPPSWTNGWRPTFRWKSSSRCWCGCRCFCPWG